jgi:hypothetical protein
MQLLCNTRCPRHPTHKKPSDTGVSDHVFHTQLRTLTYTDRHTVPINLSKPTGSTRFQTDQLGRIPRLCGDRRPFNPGLLNEVAIEMCVEELSSAILKAMAEFTPMSCLPDDPWHPTPARIQGEIS